MSNNGRRRRRRTGTVEGKREPSAKLQDQVPDTQRRTVLDPLDKHPRLMAFWNVVISLVIVTVVFGIPLSLWVVFVTGKLPTPWTYMLNLGSVLVLKIILQWIWTILVNPYAYKQARKFVVNRTGQEPPDLSRDMSRGRSKQVQSLVPTVVAAIGVATVLVTTEDLKPAFLLESYGIIVASAATAGLVCVGESLSTGTTIYPLWKNRHQYQERPSYQQGTKSDKRTGRGRR